ncbi:MAG TPA: hypothetical protein VGB98_13600, partial [Pyrinomonadaceae bacterium]
MATQRFGNTSLMLSVVLWGTLLGGIAYSHLIFFPVYLSALPDSAVVVTGTYGLHEAKFWMLIHPLLILSLVLTLVTNWRWGARRYLILISFVVYVAVIVVSAIYFIPELIAFERSAGSGVAPSEWLARGGRWQRLSWVRGATMYAAIFPLLFALTRQRASAPPLLAE